MGKNKKIGRNERCPCNSGRKYKHCHGRINTPKLLPFERGFKESDFQQKLREVEAQQRIQEQQQGLGKSIIAADLKGHKIVAVGNAIHYSRSWKTFADFLFYYIKHALGGDWGNSEIAKPYEKRHPIMQWYKQVCDYQKETISIPGEIVSTPIIGVVEAYLQLAYSLYLLAHNKELQARLINRLKHPDQFPGAYYETYVFSVLIKAGFEIEFEDEEKGMGGKRCECTATHKISGNKYSVEAKAITRYGVLGAKKNTTSKTLKSSIGDQLRKAFKKESTHPRIIFIELNLPKDSNKLPSWLGEVEQTVREKEKTLQTPQSAYVFVTNYPCHRHPRDVDYGRAVVPFGFKIPDFGYGAEYKSLKEAYYAKKKHGAIHSVMDSIKSHHEIPTTFDGSLPSEAFSEKSERCIIGRTYFFEDLGKNGMVGTITSASVSELEKKICYGVTAEDGRSYIIAGSILDDQLADYKKHPDTFFGVVHQQGGEIEEDDYMGLFEFFMNSYKNTPKERLFELMKDHPDLELLQNLEQEELAVTYCERIVCTLVEEKRSKSK